jgi:hypothetical protein
LLPPVSPTGRGAGAGALCAFSPKEIDHGDQTTIKEANNGGEIFIPLNKLKKSPRNARKMPHGEAAIEALAASIAAKGMLQNLVVEPGRYRWRACRALLCIVVGNPTEWSSA